MDLIFMRSVNLPGEGHMVEAAILVILATIQD